MNCPNCQNHCIDSDSFCMKCGFNLAKHKAESVDNAEKICPDCSAKCKADDPTCLSCGYPFGQLKKPIPPPVKPTVIPVIAANKPVILPISNRPLIISLVAVIAIVIVSFLVYRHYNGPKVENAMQASDSFPVDSSSQNIKQQIASPIGIDTVSIINKIVDYYQNEGIKNGCKMKKDISPSMIRLSFFYTNSNDYPPDISVFGVDIRKQIVTGDINYDGYSDIITSVSTTGGWAAGNVYWNEWFVFLNKNNEYILNPIEKIDCGCEDGGSFNGGVLAEILKIENGLLIGNSACYDEYDARCCPSLHYNIKLKLNGNTLTFVQKIKENKKQ
jgi:hypothetical protein